SEVVGPFAVLKLGWTNVVGYKLRQGGKGAHLGYDAVVGGPLELSMDELACLLNEYHSRALPAQDGTP
ncbi:MAG TPA: hypothetical protein VL096_15510, partial [Pirellulaceae bacterium]|nr:hypothetical protein [Pirellulaceae bacterium]